MDEQEKNPMDAVHEYWKNFPEAPASDSVKWVDPQGFEHLSTVRAWSPEKLFKAIENLQVLVLGIGGKPSGQVKPAPVAKVQERDENGTPVVDPEGQPVMINLPSNTHVFTVKGFYHGQTKNGKDICKVVVEEKPYSGKYGHATFHPPFADWKTWPVAGDPPGLFAPPAGCGHVVIRDPEGESKYPEIVEFRE
jgi:hypothetical protein